MRQCSPESRSEPARTPTFLAGLLACSPHARIERGCGILHCCGAALPLALIPSHLLCKCLHRPRLPAPELLIPPRPPRHNPSHFPDLPHVDIHEPHQEQHPLCHGRPAPTGISREDVGARRRYSIIRGSPRPASSVPFMSRGRIRNAAFLWSPGSGGAGFMCCGEVGCAAFMCYGEIRSAAFKSPGVIGSGGFRRQPCAPAVASKGSGGVEGLAVVGGGLTFGDRSVGVPLVLRAMMSVGSDCYYPLLSVTINY
jgi:hypothetical protein